MKFNKNSIISFIILVIIGTFLYQASEVLTPFLISFIVAYLLLPICNKLENYTGSRSIASALSLLLLYSICGILLFSIPYLIFSLKDLFSTLPASTWDLKKQYLSTISDIIQDKEGRLKGFINNHLESIGDHLFSFSKNLINSSMNLLSSVSFLLITPVISYYFLKDWDKVIGVINSLIPPSKRPPLMKLSKEISWRISNYIGGQLLSCFVLAILYGSTLHFLKLDYGFLIGFLIGTFSFIPFIGYIIGFIICLIIDFVKFGSGQHLAYISIAFIILQLIESNFIVPKLIGDRVGLHPAWIIFAFMAGGSLFGFLGILFALPVATIVSVILRSFISIYKDSTLYE